VALRLVVAGMMMMVVVVAVSWVVVHHRRSLAISVATHPRSWAMGVPVAVAVFVVVVVPFAVECDADDDHCNTLTWIQTDSVDVAVAAGDFVLPAVAMAS